MKNEQEIFQIVMSAAVEEKDGRSFFLVNGTSAVKVENPDMELNPGEKIVSFNRSNFSTQLSIIKEGSTLEMYTAEEWLDAQGYSSIRLITLLDLENKLTALNKDSEKLSSVRDWINQILSYFVQSSTSRSDWVPAPFSFEDTVQEVFNEINT
jgi:hypothetical protein